MISLDAPELRTVLAGLGLCIGAAVGSFAATAALRMAQGRSLVFGRSHCDGCARTLGWLDTVPLISFAANRGQCRGCGSRIDPFHLVGEGIGAVILVTCVLVLPPVTALLTGTLCLLLLVSALIDLKTLRLPDILTAGIALCAIMLAILDGHWLSGLIAAIAAGAVLFGLKAFLEHRSGKPMLGLGDVKLVAALALWLGMRTPAMLALAAILGLGVLILQRRKEALPFGPMIAIASFIVGVCVPEGWFV